MKQDPSGYWNVMLKGGAGSGSWDGPGEPRFAREGSDSRNASEFVGATKPNADLHGSASAGAVIAILSGNKAQGVYFHGTHSEAIDKIVSEGIKPGAGRNFSAPELYAGKRGESVFVTKDKDAALRYGMTARTAHNESLKARGIEPQEKFSSIVVFKVQVPDADRASMLPDTHDAVGAMRAGSIPKEWIKGYDEYTWKGDFKATTNLRKAVGGYFYVPVLITSSGK